MRRRKNLEAITASGLAPEALRQAPVDDPAAPYEQRRQAWSTWMQERDQWVADREAHAAAHGWPRGDLARFTEEDERHPVPDEPFDPDIEIAAGSL